MKSKKSFDMIVGGAGAAGVGVGMALKGVGVEESGTLKVPLESPVQVLTAVALAGIFLPCLVTVLAIARELGWRFAIHMMVRQAAAAVFSCLVLAWSVSLFYS